MTGPTNVLDTVYTADNSDRGITQLTTRQPQRTYA